MSAAPYPRRRYPQGAGGGRRAGSQIIDADLAAHGLPAAPAKPAKPAAPSAPASINPRLWRTVELVTDRATGTRKSTRILGVPGGVLVNTCTRGAAGMSEALVFVPGATPSDFPA